MKINNKAEKLSSDRMKWFRLIQKFWMLCSQKENDDEDTDSNVDSSKYAEGMCRDRHILHVDRSGAGRLLATGASFACPRFLRRLSDPSSIIILMLERGPNAQKRDKFQLNLHCCSIMKKI